jgi:threonine synthase
LSTIRCPSDHLLDVHPPLGNLTGEQWRILFDQRLASPIGLNRSGVWRYRELITPVDVDTTVTFPEGNTPLIASAPVAAWADIDGLALKHEGLNPTGSFKDRGMTAGVTRAKRFGAGVVACASTGNTAASLAAYAAMGGLEAVVLLPAGNVSPGKLAQARAYGARTVSVRGDFDRCLALVQAAGESLDLYLLNSINPYRIAGQQTIVLELLQQLRWAVPDWITFPAGNLGNTAAFGQALRLAHRLGIIDRVPRLAAVQAAGAAPFAHSFTGGFGDLVPVEADTIATAIRIGNPASYSRGVRAIRHTNGVVIDVDDADILAAKSVIDRAGIGCEPASAAAVAGARSLRRTGIIGAGDTVVAVLTGHLLKEPDTFAGSGSGDTVEIGDRLEELVAVLDGPSRRSPGP